MTRSTRQRADSETQHDEGDAEIDLDDVDPEDVVRTADGELIHEETGLIL